MTIGQTVADQRKRLGLTLKALGEKLLVSAQYLHDIEHDRRTPSQDVLEVMAEVFTLSFTTPAGQEVTYLTEDDRLDYLCALAGVYKRSWRDAFMAHPDRAVGLNDNINYPGNIIIGGPDPETE